jgi:hypothetical protein
VLAEFGKFPFEHFALGQTLLYHNCVSTITKDHILGKAWEAQFAMLVVGKKCWIGSVKKWLLKNQPHEVASFLPLVQLAFKPAPQFTATYVLQVGTAQPPLKIVPRTMHINLTRLAGVRGWVTS